MDINKWLIYEYCENLYDKYSKDDGGYYPSKHDKKVFEEASKHFDISLDKVKKIYNDMSKISANKWIKKKGKISKDDSLKYLSDIVKNNRDLPFYKLEGPPKENIENGTKIINEEYLKISEHIGKLGWSIPFIMGLNELEKLKNSEKVEDSIDEFFIGFYNDRNLKLMVKHINKSNINCTLKTLFNQCIENYNKSNYLICLSSSITILEGVLSQFSTDKKDIRMIKVCRENMESTKESNKLIKHLVWVSFYNFINKLYEKSSFDSDEPNVINRHWLLHGRTQTDWGKSDCLRVFNAIYTVVNLLNNM